MTQEFVTLPREVVEQVISALGNTETESAEQYKNEYLAMETLRAVLEQKAEQDPVGIAANMPGTQGFTMACFTASNVPVGSNLYTRPQPTAVEQEPVGEAYLCDACGSYLDGEAYCSKCGHNTATKQPVYAKPQPRQVPLTDAQLDEIESEVLMRGGDYSDVFRAIERAHNINHEGEEA